MRESKSIETSYSWKIIQESWDCIEGKRVMFFFAAAVVAFITLALSAVPVIGSVANGFLSAFLGAGFILLVHKYIQTKEFEFETIFEVLSNRDLLMKLLPLAIFMACWNGLFSLLGIVMNFNSGDIQAQLFGVGLTLIGSMILSIFTYFAIPLIIFDNYGVLNAMSESAQALAKNVLMFFLYSIIVSIVVVIAAIPLGIGLLFIFAPISCHGYLFYRKIFSL